MMKTRRLLFPILVVVVAAAAVPAFSAYKGHADDRDVEAVLSTFPALKGTPADSCAVCHRSGAVKDAGTVSQSRNENHCDYCHAVVVRDKRDSRETLNRFGVMYFESGRDAKAVRAIASKDADGDGYSNEVELTRGTNPGDASSHPGIPPAPSRTYSLNALRALSPIVEQTIFLNSTKSRSGDTYNTYRGHTLWGILEAVGVAETAESVDVLSADGYERTYTIEELRKAWPQSAPTPGLGRQELGACGWVSYNAPVEAGKALPPAMIMLAFEENGRALQRASMDAATGRISGSGPLRAIAPQFHVSPPDLPQRADASCAEKVPAANRFHEEYDHNAGWSPHAVIAVRVKPLPPKTRDIDWQSAVPQCLAKEEVVFFGAIKPGAVR